MNHQKIVKLLLCVFYFSGFKAAVIFYIFKKKNCVILFENTSFDIVYALNVMALQLLLVQREMRTERAFQDHLNP